MKPMGCGARMVLCCVSAPPAKVTIRASPAPSSSAPAPRQLAQGAPTLVAEPAPASSSPSALATEYVKNPIASSVAVAAAQGGAASEAEDTTDLDLAPVSQKLLLYSASRGFCTVGSYSDVSLPSSPSIFIDLVEVVSISINGLFYFTVC